MNERHGEWKIHWTIKIIFMPSKDNNKKRLIHLKINKKVIIIGIDHIDRIILWNDIYEIIRDLFNSLLQMYQAGLEQSMNGSNFAFDYVNALFCKFHKIILNCGDGI